MARGHADDATRCVANLEVLDEQRLRDELRRQHHCAGNAPAAQAACLAIGGCNPVRRQTNEELLGTAAIGDYRRMRRQPCVR